MVFSEDSPAAGSQSGRGGGGSSRITTFLLDGVCSSEWDPLVLWAGEMGGAGTSLGGVAILLRVDSRAFWASTAFFAYLSCFSLKVARSSCWCLAAFSALELLKTVSLKGSGLGMLNWMCDVGDCLDDPL